MTGNFVQKKFYAFWLSLTFTHPRVQACEPPQAQRHIELQSAYEGHLIKLSILRGIPPFTIYVDGKKECTVYEEYFFDCNYFKDWHDITIEDGAGFLRKVKLKGYPRWYGMGPI